MKIVYILLTASMLTASAFAQTISQLKLDNKQSILNGKAYFLFPADARNIARQTDIMSADPNTNRETRIIMDTDKQRLVFFARELFSTADKKNFYEVIKEDVKDAFTAKILKDSDSLMAILSTPIRYDSLLSGIVINNLVVRVQDGTVFSIAAYINPEAFKDKDQYQILSERVFSSIIKGERKVNYAARTENYTIAGGKKSLAFDLPSGYVITSDAKYDFEVLHFQKIKPLGDTSHQSLTFYLGHHPSYFHPEYQMKPEDAEKQKSNFLGKEVEWLYFKNNDEAFYLKEQKIPANDLEENLVIHIAMISNQTRIIDELTEMVKKFRVVEKR